MRLHDSDGHETDSHESDGVGHESDCVGHETDGIGHEMYKGGHKPKCVRLETVHYYTYSNKQQKVNSKCYE